MTLRIPVLLLLAAAGVPPALAQPPAGEASCESVRVALPPELAGWSTQTPVSAGTKPGEGATLEVGRATLVSLHSAKHLGFAAPAKGEAEGNGGTLALAIPKSGTYRVALGDAAWIEMVQGGKPVASRSHAHGPRCSGIRKIVEFTLAPGNYTVQLSGSPADSVALMVVRVG